MIVFISCGKDKLKKAAPAKDLYQGSLFKLQRQYAEKYGHEWFILSAKYGVLEPDTVIAPYNVKLNDLGRVQTKNWALKCVQQLIEMGIVREQEVLSLCPEAYAAVLRLYFQKVKEPVRGLPIGKRMAAIKKAL